MDRAAFLSSLPFLIPLHSPAWPPAKTTSTTAACAGCGKMLLGESYDDSRTFVLSIEVLAIPSSPVCAVQNKMEASRITEVNRPAFFKTAKVPNEWSDKISSATSSDPALASIQMVVIMDLSEKASTSVLYVRVDGQHVYAVDLRQATKLEFEPESHDDDDDVDDSYRRRKVSRPCSLIMLFDGVLLRIFRNNLEACREDNAMLTAICQTLSELECNTVFVADEVTSPIRVGDGSSGSSTTVYGQNEELLLQGGNHPLTTTNRTGNKRPNDSATGNDHPTARIQRQCDIFHESLSSLSTVQQILNIPVSAIAGDDDKDDNDNSNNAAKNNVLSLNPLLNRTAHLVCQSYVSSSDRMAVTEHYETLSQQIQQDMERTLNSFFPTAPPHRSGRGAARYSGSSTNNNNNSISDQQSPQVSGATAARAFAELMEQQKRIVEDRHKLLLLPTRG